MGVNCAQPRHKVVLKDAYCLFCWVGAVIMGGNQLEGVFVGVFDKFFEGSGTFIIHSMVLRAETSFCKKVKHLLVHSTMLML